MHELLTEQLDRAVAEVFSTMLDLRCDPVPSATGTIIPPFPPLVASVRFSGTLIGICIMQLDLPAAAGLTAHLTGIDADALSPALLPDTVAELCNMVAGAWKSMQPPSQSASALSPPHHGFEATLTHIFPRTLTRLYRFHPYQLTLALSVA